MLFRSSLTYAYNRYRYTDYERADQDFTGKRAPGIPRQNLFTEVAYEHEDFYLRLGLTAQTRLYTDDANSQSAPGQALVGLRMGKRMHLGEQQVEPYLGLDNLFDRDYFDNVRINDGNGRYFEPGPGRTLYAGIRLLF